MPSSTRMTVAAPLNAAKPALDDFGPEEQLLRAGPCGSSPTVPTVPLARRHHHLDETFTVSVLRCSRTFIRNRMVDATIGLQSRTAFIISKPAKRAKPQTRHKPALLVTAALF